MLAAQNISGSIAAIQSLPRISLSSQLRGADYAIIVLIALGGLAGFPGFAKYSDLKTAVAGLEYKPAWASLLLIFNYLLIYRKIGKCYFVAWLPMVHAFLLSGFISVVCILGAELTFLNAMSWLDAAITVQSGLAAVYLIVQGWLDFKPDVRSLAELSASIDIKVAKLKDMRPSVVDLGAVRMVSELCDKFLSDLKASLSDSWRDETAQEALKVQEKRVKAISQALKAPLHEVPDALGRLGSPQNEETAVHA
jgi:hypothetical protein